MNKYRVGDILTSYVNPTFYYKVILVDRKRRVYNLVYKGNGKKVRMNLTFRTVEAIYRRV